MVPTPLMPMVAMKAKASITPPNCASTDEMAPTMRRSSPFGLLPITSAYEASGAHDRADECGDHGNENGGGESGDGVRFEEFAEIVQGESAVCVLEGADDHDDGGREQEAGGVGEERDGHAERADFAAMRGDCRGYGWAASLHSACLAPADGSRMGGDCCSHGCMRAFIRLLCSEIAL